MSDRPPTLEEIQTAAKFLPDPNNVEDKRLTEGFWAADETRIVIEVNGKKIQFDLTTESGKGSHKFWFYHGAVEVER